MFIETQLINNQTHYFYWDEQSREIEEQVETAHVIIGYAQSEEEARAFIEF